MGVIFPQKRPRSGAISPDIPNKIVVHFFWSLKTPNTLGKAEHLRTTQHYISPFLPEIFLHLKEQPRNMRLRLIYHQLHKTCNQGNILVSGAAGSHHMVCKFAHAPWAGSLSSAFEIFSSTFRVSSDR